MEANTIAKGKLFGTKGGFSCTTRSFRGRVVSPSTTSSSPKNPIGYVTDCVPPMRANWNTKLCSGDRQDNCDKENRGLVGHDTLISKSSFSPRHDSFCHNNALSAVTNGGVTTKNEVDKYLAQTEKPIVSRGPSPYMYRTIGDGKKVVSSQLSDEVHLDDVSAGVDRKADIFASAVDNIIAAAEAIAQRDGALSPLKPFSQHGNREYSSPHVPSKPFHFSDKPPSFTNDTRNGAAMPKPTATQAKKNCAAGAIGHVSSNVTATSTNSNETRTAPTDLAVVPPAREVRSLNQAHMNTNHSPSTPSTFRPKRIFPSPAYLSSSFTPSPCASFYPATKRARVCSPASSTSSNCPTESDHAKYSQTASTEAKRMSEEEEIDQALKAANEIQTCPTLYRSILLHMALERETPRKFKESSVSVAASAACANHPSAPSVEPNQSIGPTKYRGDTSAGNLNPNLVIGEGFYWKDYPALENILRRFMEEYYEMSENRPQSKKQQQFNNRLVSIIHHTATSHGWTFDPESFGGGNKTKTSRSSKPLPLSPLNSDFNSKKLRDRIRCYYKTHVQNSKKRLVTLLKNPTKPKNREVLLRIIKEVKENGSSIASYKTSASSTGTRPDQGDHKPSVGCGMGGNKKEGTTNNVGHVQDVRSECVRTDIRGWVSQQPNSPSNHNFSNIANSSHSLPSNRTLPTTPHINGNVISHNRQQTQSEGEERMALSNHAPASSPFRRLQHAAILQSMRHQHPSQTL